MHLKPLDVSRKLKIQMRLNETCHIQDMEDKIHLYVYIKKKHIFNTLSAHPKFVEKIKQ